MASRSRHILYTWLVIFFGWGSLFRLFGALDLDLSREFLIMIALGERNCQPFSKHPQG